MPTVKKTLHRPWQPVRKSHDGRKQSNEKFYLSPQWRKLRALKIEQSPLCEQCTRKGITTSAQVVDHITPINQGGAPLAIENLQSLCQRCHNSKSGGEKHYRP